ncbi:Y4bD/Y4pK family protein, partial [Paraburkholderia phymatum]|uniref:Y4bD/Y4pK family protein n=1 Tax=Paraburkholderia phymatum TaxID=148447 RepID=UPI00318117F4
RSARTAQALNEHLGWAEICHPFHPLKGQRFPVLKRRRVSGIETLIVGHAKRGSFSIPREWTDWGSPVADPQAPRCYFDPGMLLDLVALIEQLTESDSTNSPIKGA